MLCNTQPLSKSPRPLSALLVGIPQGWGASCWGPTAPVPPQFNQQTSSGCTGKRKGGEEEETEGKKGRPPSAAKDGAGCQPLSATLPHPITFARGESCRISQVRTASPEVSERINAGTKPRKS